MIKFEHTEVMGWEAAVRGMRNPMNSWEKSDSFRPGKWCEDEYCVNCDSWDPLTAECCRHIGPNDLDLMKRLCNAGTDHRKFMRMIAVYVDITAPIYWWKEFDTYRVGVEKNSCSTMHKIHAKEFTLEDFSCENLIDELEDTDGYSYYFPKCILEEYVIPTLNACREVYLKTKDKKYWWQMIQLLPSSYNQKRTVMLNYEVLANIYKSRRAHKLDEWAEHDPMIIGMDTDEGSYSFMGFCDWIKTLPYSVLIIGEE